MRAAPKWPILLSIGAAVTTLLLKAAAYWLTGSVGLLSDALESLINLVASTTALVCLWYASQPVDPSHAYGHEKIEYFSSGLEGMLILIAAGGIAWYALDRLFWPQSLQELGLGTTIALAASLVNLAVAQVLLRVGKAYQSIVLEADGHHLMTDVWTSVAVVGGLFIVWLSERLWSKPWLFLDPLIALLVAANILRTGLKLVVRSFDGLMDHALPPAEQDLIRATIAAHLQAGMHFHALRTRQAGAHRFADFHLLVPGAWTVQKAHDLTERVEEAVRLALPGLEVTVHIEPVEERAAWHDSELLAHEDALREQSPR